MEEYDVAIVGGGVAGLSTAVSLSAKTNARLLLIEKGAIGDQTKTSPFTFPDVVDRFHLSEAVLQKYTRLTYKSPTGVTASFKYEKPTFVTLDYGKTCSILLNRIKKENFSALEKTEALDFKTDNAKLELTLSDSSNTSCSVLVDAAGSSFFTSRKLGTRLPALYSHPYGEFLEGCEIEDPEEMCIFTGRKYGNGGGWLYPIGNTKARFGFATITRSRKYPTEIVQGNFRKAMRDFHPYNKMLAEAKSRRPEYGTIPIGALNRFVTRRILVVGDAAGQATPWYNEGIRPALEGGKLCAKVIAEAFNDGKFHKEALKNYGRLWRAANGRMYAYAKTRASSYFRSQEAWDDSVRYQASLTPEEMMGIIRYCRFPGEQSAARLLFSQKWTTHRLRRVLERLILRIRDTVMNSLV